MTGNGDGQDGAAGSQDDLANTSLVKDLVKGALDDSPLARAGRAGAALVIMFSVAFGVFEKVQDPKITVPLGFVVAVGAAIVGAVIAVLQKDQLLQRIVDYAVVGGVLVLAGF